MGRKPKYEKTYTKIWKCKDCGYEMYYNAMKCPLCGCESKNALN